MFSGFLAHIVPNLATSGFDFGIAASDAEITTEVANRSPRGVERTATSLSFRRSQLRRRTDYLCDRLLRVVRV
jgi:hypothetical protein